MFRIYGYEPGACRPTAELLLAHKHPDDRARAARIFSGRTPSLKPLVWEHRITDALGRSRVVVLYIQAEFAQDGRPLALRGSAVDVTQAERAHYVSDEPYVAGLHAQLVDLSKAVESRDLIGQAKGILMERLKISADEAFDLLRQTSMAKQVKLTAVADELVFSGQLPELKPAGKVR